MAAKEGWKSSRHAIWLVLVNKHSVLRCASSTLSGPLGFCSCSRWRPAAGRASRVSWISSESQYGLKLPPTQVNEPPKEFTFDGAYNWESKQVDVYDGTCRPIVNQVLEGFNGTVFAYGQTGTGKTFSMEGVAGDPDLKGVIPRCFEHIFDEIGAIDEKEFCASATLTPLSVA